MHWIWVPKGCASPAGCVRENKRWIKCTPGLALKMVKENLVLAWHLQQICCQGPSWPHFPFSTGNVATCYWDRRAEFKGCNLQCYLQVLTSYVLYVHTAKPASNKKRHKICERCWCTWCVHIALSLEDAKNTFFFRKAECVTQAHLRYNLLEKATTVYVCKWWKFDQI